MKTDLFLNLTHLLRRTKCCLLNRWIGMHKLGVPKHAITIRLDAWRMSFFNFLNVKLTVQIVQHRSQLILRYP